MNSAKSTETELQRLLLGSYARALPELRLFRRNVMVGETATGTKVRAGIKGQADLYGFWSGVRPAIAVEVELKAARGRLTPEQETWAEFCRARGVVHLVLRAESNETPNETIDRWIRCLTDTLQPFRTTQTL